MSGARLRRCFLGAACVWAGLSVAGGVWWMAAAWDEYRHLDHRWSSMRADLPDVFGQSLMMSVAAVGFFLFLGLPERKRLPVYTALAVSGVMGLVIPFVMLCLWVMAGIYFDHLTTRSLSGSRGGVSLNYLLRYEVSGWVERQWVPLVFALLVGLVLFVVSRIPPFRRWVTRPALFAVAGLAAGVMVESVWWWRQFPGCGYFGHDDSPWVGTQFVIAFGSLHAFLFSVASRYLQARRDYWEERGGR